MFAEHRPPAKTSTLTVSPDSVEAVKPSERTPWFLGFLCFLIPVLPAYSVPPGPLKSNGSPAKLIAVVLFGLATLGFILIRRTARTRAVRPGVILILLFFLLQLVMYGVGLSHVGDMNVESSKTRAFITVLANVGVALYITTRIETTRQRTFVLGCLAVGLSLACLVGLMQSITGGVVELRFFLAPPGFVINSEDLVLAERLGAIRVVGTSQHAIEFSVLAAVSVPLTIHFARFAAKREVRWVAALGAGLALVAMPAAVSRSGIIALGAALLVYMWNFSVRQILLAVVAGSAAIGSYIAMFPSTANALWGTITGAAEDESVLSRTADYAAVSRTFREHPLFGRGLGGNPPSEFGFLDNEWLQAIVQGGSVGLIGMVVLAVGGVFGISARLRRAMNARERDQAYMIGAMFVGILASSFTFDLFSFQQACLILFIMFGLLWTDFSISLPDAGTVSGEAQVAIQ